MLTTTSPLQGGNHCTVTRLPQPVSPGEVKLPDITKGLVQGVGTHRDGVGVDVEP
jgi:hypothetical protein